LLGENTLAYFAAVPVPIEKVLLNGKQEPVILKISKIFRKLDCFIVNFTSNGAAYKRLSKFTQKRFYEMDPLLFYRSYSFILGPKAIKTIFGVIYARICQIWLKNKSFTQNLA
jgi:hypothetical protein